MITTTLVLFPIAIVAGVMGAILGLGGGIIIVPALTLLFGVPMRTAVAASTVSIIATSTGAAVAYLNDKLTNIRVAMWLEMGTATGATTGALVAGYLNQRFLFILFGALLGIGLQHAEGPRQGPGPHGGAGPGLQAAPAGRLLP